MRDDIFLLFILTNNDPSSLSPASFHSPIILLGKIYSTWDPDTISKSDRIQHYGLLTFHYTYIMEMLVTGRLAGHVLNKSARHITF